MLKKQAVPSGAAFFLLYLAILNFFGPATLDNPRSGITLQSAKISGFYILLCLEVRI